MFEEHHAFIGPQLHRGRKLTTGSPVKPRRNPVALGLEGKKAIVAEVQKAAESALSAVVADSRGVTVSKMAALRKEARENGVWVKVVRNTLARRALGGTA